MRIALILIGIFLSFIAKAQYTPVDSTYTRVSLSYYNQAGYYIGKDSFHRRTVRYANCGDTITRIKYDTLIQRFPQRFITMDSIVDGGGCEECGVPIGDLTDSLDTRLASYTDNTNLEEKIEDKIGDKLLISGGSKSYNDATGETTLTITASGLTAEQVLDTVANTIQVGDYLKKTKDDSGDSLYIELLLKDAYKVVWGSNYWKSVWFPTNTTSGTQTWGIQWNNTGTVTAPTKSTTNKFQFFTRAENLQTTNSTTNVAGIRPSATVVGFGNSSGLGGFYMTAVWGPATGCSNSTQRGFFGMSTSTSNPTDVDPSTLTNIFGMGWDDDDTNVQFMHNDGSGTATKVDLGSSFPVTSADRTDVYRITMYSPANSSTVYYKIDDIKDGDVATGTVSSDLPSNTVFFAPRGYTSVGGTNTVTGFAIMQLELFSEY